MNTFHTQTKDANLIEHFEPRDGYVFYQLAGRVSIDQVVKAVTQVIVATRDQGVKRLLVDASKLSGFASPSVADRYFIVRGWAEVAGGQVEMSMVVQQHLIDPDRFGVIVATNLGMRANVFSSQSEAITWLLSGQP